MDLLRHTKHVLADQFQVHQVNEGLLCVIGPFCLGDEQYVEVYVRELPPAVELSFYPGLTEFLTLEALQEFHESEPDVAALFERCALVLHRDRLSRATTRERLLDDLIGFSEAIQSIDRAIRRGIGKA